MQAFIRDSAWKFLLEQGITGLPVDPFVLARRNNWLVYTYEDFSRLIHKSVDTLISKYEKDGFSFWSARMQQYIICYNSNLPFSVCRWTLLHEMGHIYLRHITQASALSRLRNARSVLMEIEAQGFARRILCPSIVLHYCRALEADDIMRLCVVSREAAIYRSEYMKTLEAREKFGVHPLERKVAEQFRPFIRQHLQHHRNPSMHPHAR